MFVQLDKRFPKQLITTTPIRKSQNQTFGTILNPTVPKEVVYSKNFVEE